MTPMRASPIDSITAGTTFEAVLGLEDVGRNPGASHFPCNAFQSGITFNAARQKLGLLDAGSQKARDFLNLLEQFITLDQKRWARLATIDQVPVTGQRSSVFSPTALDEMIIFDFVVVGGVITQDTHPLSQSPQHHIGQEIGREKRRDLLGHDYSRKAPIWRNFR